MTVLAQPGRSSRCSRARWRTVAGLLGHDDAVRVEQAADAVEVAGALLDIGLSGPVAGTGAGFHADHTERQGRDRASSLSRCNAGHTSSGRLASVMPCTANTFLARSIPTHTMAMGFPFGVNK